MASRVVRFFTASHGWEDILFRSPPKQPDARMVYIGGCGVITLLRGFFYLFGTRPDAALFEALGGGFVLFWSVVWVVVGAAVVVIAGTGHRWPEADRVAAFLMLMLWWVWGLLFLISGIFFESARKGNNIFSGLTLLFTGLVISAGVIQGLRKTHEIQLRQVAVERIRTLEEAVLRQSAEIQALRERLEPPES